MKLRISTRTRIARVILRAGRARPPKMHPEGSPFREAVEIFCQTVRRRLRRLSRTTRINSWFWTVDRKWSPRLGVSTLGLGQFFGRARPPGTRFGGGGLGRGGAGAPAPARALARGKFLKIGHFTRSFDEFADPRTPRARRDTRDTHTNAPRLREPHPGASPASPSRKTICYFFSHRFWGYIGFRSYVYSAAPGAQIESTWFLGHLNAIHKVWV